MASTPEERAAVDRMIVQHGHDQQESAGTMYEGGKIVGKGIYGLAKLGVKLVGVAFEAPGSEGTIGEIAQDVQNVADTIRAGPEAWTEHYAEKSLLADQLRKQGRYFEAGQVWGPEFATALTAAAPVIGKLAGEAGVVVEGASGDAAVASLSKAPGAQFFDPGIVEELDEAYFPAGRPAEPPITKLAGHGDIPVPARRITLGPGQYVTMPKPHLN